jgi:hypothetical protein
LTRLDRLLWVWFSRVWSQWRSALAIVKPETVIGWHRWRTFLTNHAQQLIAADFFVVPPRRAGCCLS